MASAWGYSFGSAWGNAWGLITGQQTETVTGGWWGPRYKTRKEIDDERRRLGILPPVAEIARKAAQKAAQSHQQDEQALRLSIEALRAEIGKQEAAALRDAFIQLVRIELTNAWIEQEKEEEAIAAFFLMCNA